MVAVGLTLTAVPLLAARFPGVITPVPFPNIPVKPVLVPSTIVGGFAAKLVMKAWGGGGGALLDELLQPARNPKARLRAMAHPA